MRHLKVNGCGNCPFLHSEYDDFAMGHSSIDNCGLALFNCMQNGYNIHTEYTISVHDEMGSNPENVTPDWCPLKKVPIQIQFEDYDLDRQNEISFVKKEIIEWEKMYDMVEEHPLMSQSADIKLKELYAKLQELTKNSGDENI